MHLFRKLFRFPTPIELGRSDNNALPSRDFSPGSKGYSWEDYDEELKKLYPIKFWISKTAFDWIKYKIWFPIINPIKRLRYWIVSHVIPKRRYHTLDLRQNGGYQYGWCDVPEKMIYAMFNLLGEYLKEEPYDLLKDYSIEEINADPGMKVQYEWLEEAKAIHYWWNVERKEKEKIQDELSTRWYDANRIDSKRDSGEADQLFQVLQNAQEDDERKLDEMLARLLKIRRGLWT